MEKERLSSGEKKMEYDVKTLKKQLENLTELKKEYHKNGVTGPYLESVDETIQKVKGDLKEKQAA